MSAVSRALVRTAWLTVSTARPARPLSQKGILAKKVVILAKKVGILAIMGQNCCISGQNGSKWCISGQNGVILAQMWYFWPKWCNSGPNVVFLATVVVFSGHSGGFTVHSGGFTGPEVFYWSGGVLLARRCFLLAVSPRWCFTGCESSVVFFRESMVVVFAKKCYFAKKCISDTTPLPMTTVSALFSFLTFLTLLPVLDILTTSASFDTFRTVLTLLTQPPSQAHDSGHRKRIIFMILAIFWPF